MAHRSWEFEFARFSVFVFMFRSARVESVVTVNAVVEAEWIDAWSVAWSGGSVVEGGA